MKKILSIIALVLMIISISTITMATDVSVSLRAEKQEVEKGAEIKITIGANGFTREGANKAIEGKIEFDSEKLKYETITWQNGWTGTVSTDGTGLTAMKSVEVGETENIAIITYKVKQDVEEGNTKIELKEILTSADGDEVAASDVETTIKIIEKQVVPETPDEPQNPDDPETVKLESIEITKAPTKTTYKVGEKFDKTGMTVIAKYSDGTSKEITNYTVENGDKLEKGQASVKISYKEGTITKTAEQKITVNEEAVSTPKDDDTGTEEEMPDTGGTSVVGIISVVAIIAVVCLVKYNKYKEV